VHDPNRIAFLAPPTAARRHREPFDEAGRVAARAVGERLFPAPLHGHPETSPEPVRPAILIRKDEDDGGNVTEPDTMPAGKAAYSRGRRAGHRSIVRVLPQACEVDAVDEDPE
jgi:hypothetical protein